MPADIGALRAAAEVLRSSADVLETLSLRRDRTTV
jgi:hypothetical protein